MSNFWGTTTAITRGVTPVSSADAIRDLSAGGTQTPGALGALGARVLPIPNTTAWTVTPGSVSGFQVSPGAGILYDSAHVPDGWAFVRTKAVTDNVTDGVTAGASLYIIASVVYASVVGDPDSREAGSVVFKAQASETAPAGAIVIAKITTNGSSIVTAVVDKRPPEFLFGVDPFAQDRSTTTGLIFGYKAGAVRAAGGTFTVVAAGTATLTSATLAQYIQVANATGVISVTTSVPDTSHTALWVIDTDATSIIAQTRLFPYAGAVGSGTVTSVTGTAPIVSSGGATPAISLSDGGVTDSKIGNRTAVPANAPSSSGPGTLQNFIDWFANRIKAITGTTNWWDAPGTTLATSATHQAAAAPHSGHTKVDGTVAFTGDQSMGGHKITNGADGVAATDYATYGQVTAIAGGMIPSNRAQCAATGNVNISNPGTNTFDAVALSNPGVDRVVLPNQTTGTEGGVYVWNGNAVAMTRATDFDSSGEVVAGRRVPIAAGAAYGGKALYIYSAGTLGTDPVLWSVDAGGTGEANTASNTGAGAGSVYQTKSGVNLVLRTLKANSTRLSIATNTDTVDVDVVEANLTLSNLGGTLGATQGGTGLTSYALGDLPYASATNGLSKLPGNTTAVKQYLGQTGTGAVSAAPVWGAIAGADVPVMGASGGSHAQGAVPDPGSLAGSSRYLREDGLWQIPGAATAPATVHLVDAATIATDGSTGVVFFVSSAVDRTMGVPTNSVPGLAYNWFWKNTDSGAHTLTLITTGAGCFRYGQNVTGLPSVPAGKLLRFTAMYDPIDGKLGVSAYDIF